MQIVAELPALSLVEGLAVQGKPTDIGGYYQPDDSKAAAALRPSQTFNAILSSI